MIFVENLSKTYPDKDLFSNVNLLLKHGMRVGLVGPNGIGKTTLLRIMIGEESPDSGNVQIDKSISIGHLAQDIVSGSDRSILEEVLDAYPEIRDLEAKMFSLSKEISKDPKNVTLIKKLGKIQNRFEVLDGWRLEEKAKKILGGLGFTNDKLSKPMNNFSGGWRMRVAIAALLIQEPNILFLDEPTNHLDLEATIWLESFISDWKGAIVIISHDREFLDRSVNYILEINFKKVTLYHGNYSKYKSEKSIRLEQHQNAFNNQQKQIKDNEKFIERFRYKSSKAAQVQSRIKVLEKMDKVEEIIEDNKAINLLLPKPSRLPLNVASCKKVTKQYGNIEVFRDIDFEVQRGHKIGLVGYNGAGKSTLLKMLAGVEPATSGIVQIGENVDRAYFAQHQLDILDPDDTVFESIQKVSSGWSETELRTYLGSFMFKGDEIQKYVKVLSGGEKSRIAMARMLVKPSHLLLLDEPTNHLDMVTRNVVEVALTKFSGSIVCISHDRHFLNQVTNITCEVGQGGIEMFEGNYDYYKWKMNVEKPTSTELVEKKISSKEKSNYIRLKKIRNRLVWINKRFNKIDSKLEIKRAIIQDPANGNNYALLQDTLKEINVLETEYLGLIEEQESLRQ